MFEAAGPDMRGCVRVRLQIRRGTISRKSKTTKARVIKFCHV
uniref:Uncharacterized protein n=1 Tax=Ascaris lumbricoides TaxID=6252 RepID=A0A0M3IK43_ASCLU